MSSKANESPRARRELLEEIELLRARLDEAEQTLAAIRNGDVDAVVVTGPHGDQVFSLTSAERTYRLIVETMHEAALTVSLDETILFCNQRFCDLMNTPMPDIISQKLTVFTAPAQHQPLRMFLADARSGPCRSCLKLRGAKGAEVPVQLAASLLVVDSLTSICLVVSDLTAMETQAAELQDTNTALRVLLKRRDREREETVATILANLNKQVVPTLEKLRQSGLTEKQQYLLQIAELQFKGVLSPICEVPEGAPLTKTERQISAFVLQRKTTKEIAEILDISPRTVDTHRNNIRKKLRIKEKSKSLREHLITAR